MVSVTNMSGFGLLQARPEGVWPLPDETGLSPINTSGITPLAFKVLILPDPVEEVTKGGIIIPIEKATKDEYATTRGMIVAVSGSAFSHVTDEEWGEDKPKPGDHVVYTRYAGFRCEGDDGKDYLIVKGEDIHAKF